MANFAVIENNVVVNCIVAETLRIAEQVTNKPCMQAPDEVGIGFTWDPELGVFTPPILPGM